MRNLWAVFIAMAIALAAWAVQEWGEPAVVRWMARRDGLLPQRKVLQRFRAPLWKRLWRGKSGD